MTNSHGRREIAVVISSTTPSTKYSCSASPVMSGTAIPRARACRAMAKALSSGPSRQRNAVDAHRSGNVLDLLLAHILKAEIDFVAHLVAHDAADADAPGSAKASSRAATLTPSP